MSLNATISNVSNKKPVIAIDGTAGSGRTSQNLPKFLTLTT